MSFVWQLYFGFRRWKTIVSQGLVGKQLLIRKKCENVKCKGKNIERSSFTMPTHTHTTENPSNLSVDHRQAPAAAFAATNMDQKSVIYVEKRDIFNKVARTKEISLPECQIDRDWEYSENCD